MNRREFLRTTTVATASLVTLRASEVKATAIEVPRAMELIDVNVSLGRWPTRRLPLDETPALVRKLRQQGVAQAWVGNFDAAFGADCKAANGWLARECAKRGREVLVPFGTVNLARPDWEEELRRCREEHRMPGLRLFPNYHGYKLTDLAFARLLSLAAEQKLIIQIVVSLEDERTQPRTSSVSAVDVKPLLTLLKKPPVPPIGLLNWYRVVKIDMAKMLARLGVSFDIATVENVGGVANLAGQIPVEQILLGSHAPFLYMESAMLKLKESGLGGDKLAVIGANAARRMLTLAKGR